MQDPDITTELDSRLMDLIRRSFDSFVKWDVLKFFREHPDQTESAHQIAAFCGREVATVEQAAEELARSGHLIRQQIGDLMVYKLSDRPERLEEVDLFLSAGDDQAQCVSIMAALVRAEETPPPTPAERRYRSPAIYG